MVTPQVTTSNQKYVTCVWVVDGSDTDLSPTSLAQYSDKTIQIEGDLDGATINLQGSMDGTNWVNLTTDGTTEISGVGMHWIWENPKFLKPVFPGITTEEPDVTITIGTSSLQR